MLSMLFPGFVNHEGWFIVYGIKCCKSNKFSSIIMCSLFNWILLGLHSCYKDQFMIVSATFMLQKFIQLQKRFIWKYSLNNVVQPTGYPMTTKGLWARPALCNGLWKSNHTAHHRGIKSFYLISLYIWRIMVGCAGNNATKMAHGNLDNT